MLVAAGVAAAATIAVDQATKAMVRGTIDPGEIRDVALDGQIAVGHIQNHGSAYGLVGTMPSWVPVVGTAAIGGALLALNRGSARPLLAGIGAGMVLGGGAGNVIDRLARGHVTDFAHTSEAFGFYNVADVAINVGLLAAGGALLLKAR